MVGGFNHNFLYKEQMYHVQTEDSGVKKSQITTLLYCGGTILARHTSSYADISQGDDFAAVVELRMKEQHKQMLRELKKGCHDERIAEMNASKPEKQPEKKPVPAKVSPRKKVLSLDKLIVAYLNAGR